MTSGATGAGLRLTIDLRALVRNWLRLSALVAPAECAAVVKADAYGTGIEQAVPALRDAGCRTFFVAYASEGLRVRQVAADGTVYVLSGFDPAAAELYRSAALRPVLNSMADGQSWAAADMAVPAALHLDTGMNRLGMDIDEAEAFSAPRHGIELSLVLSHLACADEPGHALNALQLGRFTQLAERFRPLPLSFANSAGIHLGRSYHFDMARPGIALYGGASHPDAQAETVVTAEARIVQVRTGRAGETVGYAATRSLDRNTRIAVVGAGYADGYVRSASGSDGRPGGRAWLDGYFAPILGRVSMDLIALDVTDIPGDKARPHAWVELFGPNHSIDAAAGEAGTIGYELLTGLSRRAERIYLT